MSITGAHLLAMGEALAGYVDQVAEIDYVIPSPFAFAGKSEFFASLSATNDTKLEIETTLIRAAWIRYLNFEDMALNEGDVREIDDPVRIVKFECTIFHEGSPERLDETVPLDAFDKTVKKSNHEHNTAVFGVVGAMQGSSPISDLQPSSFMVAETVTPTQIGDTENNVECAYMPGVTGDQTKLELAVKIQTPC